MLQQNSAHAQESKQFSCPWPHAATHSASDTRHASVQTFCTRHERALRRRRSGDQTPTSNCDVDNHDSHMTLTSAAFSLWPNPSVEMDHKNNRYPA
eukprot:6178508-Amphidinium_carterae.1